MSDEKFEEFLQREAKAYNAPPQATPRDEMWRAISAVREARRGAGGAPVTPLGSRTPRPGLRYASWIGMAATLLVGVGIGRFALQHSDTAITAPPAGAVADAGDPANVADPTGDSNGVVGATDPRPADDPSASDPTDAPRRAPQIPLGSPSAPTRVASATPRNSGMERSGTRDEASASTPGTDRDASSAIPGTGLGELGSTPEQVASREHLQRAEALITVVAATPADAMMDSLTGRWAREMLTNTRLILDSPAGDDPARRRLLEDLETLLVQLVQRSGGAVDEKFLIDRTLERTQLLTRLRTSAAGI